MPSLLKGILTAAPSGKFWSPIPIAKIIAAVSDDPGMLSAAAPKATPIANPSGILCKVIAITNNKDLLFLIIDSLSSISGCGRKKSVKKETSHPLKTLRLQLTKN